MCHTSPRARLPPLLFDREYRFDSYILNPERIREMLLSSISSVSRVIMMLIEQSQCWEKADYVRLAARLIWEEIEEVCGGN